MLLVDLDPAFQSVLPNNTGGVVAPGQTGLVLGNRLGMDPGTSTLPLSNVVAQTVAGGQNAPVGRAEVDPALNQPFYLVPSESQRPRLLSQTLIQNVTVLQVGNFETIGDTTATSSAEGKPTPTPQPPKPPDIITLVVNPQDAVTINYLIYNNVKLTLALRGVNDDQDIPTQSVTLKFLMEQYNIAIPEKLGYGIEPKIEKLPNPKLENETNPQPQ
jgi:pilus assembly protein CpaB